jgi:NAD(P)H-hydrate epimerase
MLRLTRAQAREVDRRSIQDYHIPGIVLMENAARAASTIATAMSKDTMKNAIIVCGGGNNGGDGFAIARHLHNAGWPVLILLASEKDYTGDALINRRIVDAMGIQTRSVHDAKNVLARGTRGLLIDALFGTGLSSPPRDDYAMLIDMMNQSGLPFLAVDVPSGLDCDTGLPLGPSCVRATSTITFVAEKTGFANPQSKQYTGEVLIGDIGCPRQLVEDIARQGT